MTTKREPMSPAERSLRARMAAHAMHARNDPVEITYDQAAFRPPDHLGPI
jgi:hypothetical protein